MPMLKAALNFSNEISEEIEHDGATGAVENGHPGRGCHAVGRQVLKSVDVAVLGPLGTLFGCQLCHCGAFVGRGLVTVW